MVLIAARDNIRTIDFREGALVLVDKPGDWTSFDVVNKIRGALRRKYNVQKIKVGHAGTLDPIATGLLLICTGKMTPFLNELQGLDKEYTGEMVLGAVTASYDRETQPEPRGPYDHISEDDIQKAAGQFSGSIEQVPPMYSAIKIKGQPLYKIARRGGDVEREPRLVTIHDLSIEDVNLPVIAFRVACSKGTYVRSLVHDMGQVLGCGAYMTELRRIRIGEYHVEDAWQLDDLVGQLTQ